MRGTELPSRGRRLCEKDYMERFAKRCTACSKEITGKFMRALDRDWHEGPSRNSRLRGSRSARVLTCHWLHRLSGLRALQGVAHRQEYFLQAHVRSARSRRD